MSTGGPRLYKDIILHVPGGPRGPEEFVRPYPLVSRATLHKVLDRLGCDMVQAPGTDTPVDFVALELQDNMLLTGLRYCVPWEARVRHGGGAAALAAGCGHAGCAKLAATAQGLLPGSCWPGRAIQESHSVTGVHMRRPAHPGVCPAPFLPHGCGAEATPMQRVSGRPCTSLCLRTTATPC